MRVSLRQCFYLAVLALIVLAGCSTSSKPYSHRSSSDTSAQTSTAVHTVQRGDTLFSISWQQGLDYQTVAAWNGIAHPYTIYPGQKIRLYPSTRRLPAEKVHTPPAQTPAPAPAEPASVETSAAKITWQWPAKGPILRQFDGDASGKKGISIGGTHGYQVRAAAGGKVVYAGSGLVGYGQLIIIKHNDTFLSAYGHNRDLLVEEGNEVRGGQVIANMGSSGTNRIQLHFEIRRNGKPVDPLRYLPRH